MPLHKVWVDYFSPSFLFQHFWTVSSNILSFFFHHINPHIFRSRRSGQVWGVEAAGAQHYLPPLPPRRIGMGRISSGYLNEISLQLLSLPDRKIHAQRRILLEAACGFIALLLGKPSWQQLAGTSAAGSCGQRLLSAIRLSVEAGYPKDTISLWKIFI